MCGILGLVRDRPATESAVRRALQTAALETWLIYVSDKEVGPQMNGYLRLIISTQAQARQFLAVVRETGLTRLA
jgi:hypothetical protein